MLEKNEGNTVKKIRSTEQILVLAILLFTYFLETFQVAYAQKAENLPQIVSWQDGKGYQSDGTFIADGWGYDTVNPAGKYVLFDENGMVQLRTETMDPVNAEDEYSGTELEPANIAVRAEIFEGFTGKVHVTIEENGGVQREYVFEEYPQEQKTFPEAYKLLLNKSVEMLDSIFERLPTDHPAKGPYQLFSKAEKVKGNAVLGLGTRLQILQNKMVQQITSHTDIDLSLPGKQKCAYFCITSDQDSTYDMLATLFTSFLSIKLVRLADRTEERVLPVPVSFILDEFPNIGVVPDFKKKLATARSRRIGMSILFQNIPQLQNRYPDNQWEEILGGCDFSIFLGCNDMTTATYYSDRTGEITVSVASIRKNFFTIRATDYVPEYSESRSIGKRQLLLPDEILRYPLDQGILIIRGHNVLRFKKMDYTEHADAGKLKMEKVVDHIPDWYRKWEKQQQEFQILDEQVYEASAPLEKNESPIKENDVQEPLTVNGAVQKTKNKKRTSTGNTVMKVDDLFVKKSKG